VKLHIPDFIQDFRDPALAQHILERIRAEVDATRTYRLMEFCGGHTHTLFRFGLPELLPENVQLLHGPGCPVCVLPIARIDAALALSDRDNTTLFTYADALRIPGSAGRSLAKAKASGADIRSLVCADQALTFAQSHPEREVIFFAIGFETTTPPTASVLDAASALQLKNFRVLCNHVLTPAAMEGILGAQSRSHIEGLIGPGHVSLVTGYQTFAPIAEAYQIPIVVSGFEPIDLLQSILALVKMINASKYGVENQYTRAVHAEGNLQAQALCERYFELRDCFEWRGLGTLKYSALGIKKAFSTFDAEALIPRGLRSDQDNKACECPSVLMGQKKPDACPLFNNPCTPENPLGACMVSSEGACAAYYRYQRIPMTRAGEQK